MKSANEAIRMLCDLEGFNDEVEAAAHYVIDSVCPCICMNDDCEYTEELEPDCRDGWCPECDAGTMKSLLILMGVI